MTFLHWKPKPGTSDAQLRKLKSMFGTVVIRWDRKQYRVDYGTHSQSIDYEIVAKDADSVIIRHQDPWTGIPCLLQINFEGDRYWFAARRFIEWFRRAPPCEISDGN
jgi:hypothetical protein